MPDSTSFYIKIKKKKTTTKKQKELFVFIRCSHPAPEYIHTLDVISTTIDMVNTDSKYMLFNGPKPCQSDNVQASQ